MNRMRLQAVLFVMGCCFALLSLSAPRVMAQETQRQRIARLVNDLKSRDLGTRMSAASALEFRGSSAASVVPDIKRLLKHKNPDVRYSAASVLGRMGSFAAPAVKELISLFKDPVSGVSHQAAFAVAQIGSSVPSVLHDLEVALTNTDSRIKKYAAYALGQIGSSAASAIPALENALKDEDGEVKHNAGMALAEMGASNADALLAMIQASESGDPRVRGAVSLVAGYMRRRINRNLWGSISAVGSKDPNVRAVAAYSLGWAGSANASAVNVLGDALADGDLRVRAIAAYALGQLGSFAASAIPALGEALSTKDNASVSYAKDRSKNVRSAAAYALGRIALDCLDKAPKMEPKQLSVALQGLETAQEALSGDLSDYADVVETKVEARDNMRRAIERLDEVQQQRNRFSLLKWAYNNRVISLLITAWMLTGLLLWRWPLALLRVNDGLKSVTALKLPAPLDSVSLAPGYLLGYGCFHYHPRVLDAWVKKYAGAARNRLREKPSFAERSVYVDIPLRFPDGDRRPAPDDFHALFAARSAALLLRGEGGSGKTTLACQMALWALADRDTGRLCRGHRMLPVFIEENLAAGGLAGDALLLQVLQRRIKGLTGEEDLPEPDLVKSLLRERRVLVIVDGLSELSKDTRSLFQPDGSALPLNALVLTSRAEEKLSAAETLTVESRLLNWQQVADFLADCLTQSGKEELLARPDFPEGLLRFSALVGGRPITAMLARLYAQHMIDFAEQIVSERPQNIPELMDAYVNEVCRRAEDAPYQQHEIHEMAQAIAWECLKTTLTPAGARYDDAMKALSTPPEGRSARPYQKDARAAITFFTDRLRLLRKSGMAGDRLKFTLDPLSEYLAARHLVVSLWRDNATEWDGFFTDAETKPDAPQSIAGFLRALGDVCEAFGAESGVPANVPPRLRAFLKEEPPGVPDSAVVVSAPRPSPALPPEPESTPRPWLPLRERGGRT